MPEKRIELVHFQITKSCNLRCWFCGQWGSHGFFSEKSGRAMSLDDWICVADEIADMSGSHLPDIVIWGGEPLCAPFADDLLFLLKKKGFRLQMITNGTLIDRHLEAIESCVDCVVVSIDGCRNIHDKIRGNGVYDKVCDNLKKLKKCKKIVSSVLTKEFCAGMSDFLSELNFLNIDELYLQNMIGLSDTEISEYKAWMKNTFDINATDIDSWKIGELSPVNADRVISEINQLEYNYKITAKEHFEDDGVYCLSPFRHIHIAWNGNVLYCTDFYDFSAGNVREEKLRDIFENEMSERFRYEIANNKCTTCRHCSWRKKRKYSVTV